MNIDKNIVFQIVVVILLVDPVDFGSFNIITSLESVKNRPTEVKYHRVSD